MWEKVKLGDVAEIITGSTPRKKNKEYWEGGDIPFITPAQLSDDTVKYVNDSDDYITEKGLEKARLLPKNAIMVCCIGSLGKLGIAERKLVTNQQINSVVFDEDKVYYKYGAYALTRMKPVMELRASSTTVNIINKTRFSKIEIPMPPIEIQQKIADALDKAQELIDKRKEQIEKLDEFVESVFLDMFGDPATNPNEWQVEKMNYFINDIRAGWSIGGESRQKKENEIGVLKISSVTTGKFLKDEYKVVDKEKIKKDLVHPLKGDVLFSRANTRELVAATCIVDDDYTDLFLPDKLWKIILDREIINSYYFVYLLRNERYRHRLTRKATGSSGSMLNISQKKLLNTKFPIAPLELQNKFAQIVEATEEKRKILEESLAEMENNFNSIMQKAFKGELF
ncbi:hypothetical protein U472_03290 [Orenia metallireducens]|uniref:Type I restriction modification DNA specificity domain-containing protein n=1 Tax=Orenia metallireducens TaxID=1413210 RepID=A0A1C0AB45_9FIRM|nr:restriction endonuclease subunit S [Orenia metallireducens]OCL27591.1 hypothetical protein U472_03290 [Orenia metallireducens]